MKVFISWSGSLSERLGQSLRNWLPNVIQSVTPYFTPSDVDKGSRWLSDITKELNQSKIGIICVTPDNLRSEWLLFESGVLSNKLDKTHVCPILFGIKPTDLAGPLKQFQATEFHKADVGKLISVINECLGDDKLPQKTMSLVFDKWWPDLESEIEEILNTQSGPAEPVRSEKEMIEEILQLSRRHDAARQAFVPPDTTIRLLRSYLDLHDMQVDQNGGYQEALDSLEKMRNPIADIVRAQKLNRTQEITTLFERFNKLSFEVNVNKEDETIPEPHDDDIPF